MVKTKVRDTSLFHGTETPLSGTVLFPNSRDRLKIIWPNGEEVEDMIITVCHPGSRWYGLRRHDYVLQRGSLVNVGGRLAPGGLEDPYGQGGH